LGQIRRWSKRDFMLRLRSLVTPRRSAIFCGFSKSPDYQGFIGQYMHLNVRFYEIRVKTNKIVDPPQESAQGHGTQRRQPV
jgi:hypothetical protein